MSSVQTTYLCVLDFEATCHEGENRNTQEIIEFPSILYKYTTIDDYKSIEYVSEFSKYVRPVLETELSAFCTELTGITQERVKHAEPIESVYAQHYKWILDNVPQADLNRLYFCTCGHWDLKTMLPLEIKNKNLPVYDVYKQYINIKKDFERKYNFNATKKAHCLREMLEQCGLTLDGRLHSGIDDTRNIAKLMIYMLEESNYDFHVFNVMTV